MNNYSGNIPGSEYFPKEIYLSVGQLRNISADSQYRASQSGFYQIYVDPVMDNVISSKDNVRSGLVAIASKFFLANDDVSVFSSDAIIYTHPPSSEPATLSKITCSILDSNGDAPEELVNGSSLFFSVVRGQPTEIKRDPLKK